MPHVVWHDLPAETYDRTELIQITTQIVTSTIFKKLIDKSESEFAEEDTSKLEERAVEIAFSTAKKLIDAVDHECGAGRCRFCLGSFVRGKPHACSIGHCTRCGAMLKREDPGPHQCATPTAAVTVVRPG